MAGRCFVLQNHRSGAAVILEIIWPAAKIDDLITLDRAGAWIDGIGADARQIINIKGQHAAFRIHRKPALDTMIARMDVAHEGFKTVCHEFHRAAHDARHGGDRDLIRIDMHLDAKAAADILADHADIAFFHAKLLGKDTLHHMRRLGGMIHSQCFIRRVVIGDDGTRFQRNTSMTPGDEARLHYLMRRRKGSGYISAFSRAGEDKIIAQFRVDHDRAGGECCLHIGLRSQSFEFDIQRGHAIFGRRAGLRNHRHNRLTLPGGAVERQRILRRRFHALQMVKRRYPGIAYLRQIMACEDAHHTRHRLGACRINGAEFRMRMGATQKRRMQHARQSHIIRIGRAPLHQPRHIRARHGSPDIGIGQILTRKAYGRGRDLVHGAALLERKVSSTASTMA